MNSIAETKGVSEPFAPESDKSVPNRASALTPGLPHAFAQKGMILLLKAMEDCRLKLSIAKGLSGEAEGLIPVILTVALMAWSMWLWS